MGEAVRRCMDGKWKAVTIITEKNYGQSQKKDENYLNGSRTGQKWKKKIGKQKETHKRLENQGDKKIQMIAILKKK